MKATIISIGDELLIGQVINTNAAYIASELNKIGIQVISITTVGDNHSDIIKSFEDAYLKSDVIIVTGGLGPTHDDITKNAVCSFFNVGLIQNNEVRENIKKILSFRKIDWNPAAEEQTYIPEGCKIIKNNLGTAAGFLFERDNKFFIVMPGVPHEMKDMMINFVIPFLSSHLSGEKIIHKTFKTTGITEAALSEMIGPVEKILINDSRVTSSLAFLPSPLGVSLRISVKSSDKELANNFLEKIEKELRATIKHYVYGINEDELELVVGKILKDKKLTISVAESCTGGLIANRITNVSGSSQYFERGVVAYSNRSKVELLGVDEDLIIKYGAVSENVAKAMAQGIRNISGSSIGISTTGIAGPTGGTAEKPVGLVWIGYSDENETIAVKNYFGNERILIKTRASQAALNLVRLKLIEKNLS